MILSLIYAVIVGLGSAYLLFYDTLGMVHVISCFMVSLIQTLLLSIAVLLYKQEYLLPKTHDAMFNTGVALLIVTVILGTFTTCITYLYCYRAGQVALAAVAEAGAGETEEGETHEVAELQPGGASDSSLDRKP